MEREPVDVNEDTRIAEMILLPGLSGGNSRVSLEYGQDIDYTKFLDTAVQSVQPVAHAPAFSQQITFTHNRTTESTAYTPAFSQETTITCALGCEEPVILGQVATYQIWFLEVTSSLIAWKQLPFGIPSAAKVA